MTNTIVTYEQAQKLKDLGYNIPCYKYYSINKKGNREIELFEGDNIPALNYNVMEGYYSAPTIIEAINFMEQNILVNCNLPERYRDVILLYDSMASKLLDYSIKLLELNELTSI
jgi:hypothetical protein